MSEKLDNLKQQRVESMLENPEYTFVRFKGAPLISYPKTDKYPGTSGLVPMTEDNFSPIAYTFRPSPSRAQIMDMFHMIEYTAPDWSKYDRYIGFYDKVWDRQELEFVQQREYVYSTDIAINDDTAAAWKFLTQLSKGDEGLARDYLQGMAPLVMMDRPTGIIWFVGDGANGKSSLLKALYRGFDRYFVSLTTADLEDGRDIPSLRGMLGNIVLESSDARVVDSKAYKSIGSHERMRVHAFQKQTGVVVESSFHTIFNANNIPTFGDKTNAIRRRTWTIPFPAHFPDNPTFERDTFTPEFLGGLYKLILDTAITIRDNGNKYQWSDATLEMKKQYDSEVNSAEAFLRHLEDTKVCGFFNFTRLKFSYETWCSDNGLTPLFMANLKRTVMNDGGATRKSVRFGDNVVNRYYFVWAPEDDNLVWLDNGYGMPTDDTEEVVKQLELGKDNLSEW